MIWLDEELTREEIALKLAEPPDDYDTRSTIEELCLWCETLLDERKLLMAKLGMTLDP